MTLRSTTNPFFEIWFPKNTQNITIVASPSFDGLKDAELTSPNYALLDRLGDRDSIYSVGKLLSRRYPNAVIHLVSSEDFSHQSLSRNFVILGGPGGQQKSKESGVIEPLEGNEACRMFTDRLGSMFSYTSDCERLMVEGTEYTSIYDQKGHMMKDYGIFAAFQNPYLKSTRIVMLHGIHTLGVLGATRIFDGDLDSMGNFDVLRKAIGERPGGLGTAFESFFEVGVMHGEVECPSLKANQVVALDKPIQQASEGVHGTHTRQLKISTISPDDLRKESIALVQIAKQQTIDSNKSDLSRLHLRIESIAQPSFEIMQKVLDICRRNIRIPPESVAEIDRVLNDDAP